MTSDKFEGTVKAIDAINAQDPNAEMEGGVMKPKEWLYSQRMTDMLADFYPEAPEALQLAARGQHIKRWVIPRESYPMDRKGYLQWRTALKKFHAGLMSSIMDQHGYPGADILKVEGLINKKGLKTDQDAQVLEDVVCLVFLKYYFDDFIAKHEERKLISIIQKTWHKMSERGQQAALALPHSRQAMDILKKALPELSKLRNPPG